MGAPCFLHKSDVLAVVVPPTGNMRMCYMLGSGEIGDKKEITSLIGLFCEHS